MIEIVSDVIDEQSLLASVKSKQCGAAVLFVGSTRQFTDGRETIKLNYECYEDLAVKVLGNLRDRAMQKWSLEACSVVHRVGTVEVGEASIAVAVSSAHRADSFGAIAWLMDQIKEQVPVWKQENWRDGGAEWIHPGVEQRSDQQTNTRDGE